MITSRRLAALALAIGIVTPGLSACGGESAEPGVDAFCTQIEPLTNLGSQLAADDDDLAGLAEQLEDLVAVAPVAVEPSVRTIADAVATMASAAEASGEQGPAALAAAFAAIEAQQAELERASEVVEGFALRECGIDLTPDDGGDTTSSEEPSS